MDGRLHTEHFAQDDDDPAENAQDQESQHLTDHGHTGDPTTRAALQAAQRALAFANTPMAAGTGQDPRGGSDPDVQQQQQQQQRRALRQSGGPRGDRGKALHRPLDPIVDHSGLHERGQPAPNEHQQYQNLPPTFRREPDSDSLVTGIISPRPIYPRAHGVLDHTAAHQSMHRDDGHAGGNMVAPLSSSAEGTVSEQQRQQSLPHMGPEGNALEDAQTLGAPVARTDAVRRGSATMAAMARPQHAQSAAAVAVAAAVMGGAGPANGRANSFTALPLHAANTAAAFAGPAHAQRRQQQHPYHQQQQHTVVDVGPSTMPERQRGLRRGSSPSTDARPRYVPPSPVTSPFKGQQQQPYATQPSLGPTMWPNGMAPQPQTAGPDHYAHSRRGSIVPPDQQQMGPPPPSPMGGSGAPAARAVPPIVASTEEDERRFQQLVFGLHRRIESEDREIERLLELRASIESVRSESEPSMFSFDDSDVQQVDLQLQQRYQAVSALVQDLSDRLERHENQVQSLVRTIETRENVLETLERHTHVLQNNPRLMEHFVKRQRDMRHECKSAYASLCK